MTRIEKIDYVLSKLEKLLQETNDAKKSLDNEIRYRTACKKNVDKWMEEESDEIESEIKRISEVIDKVKKQQNIEFNKLLNEILTQ